MLAFPSRPFDSPDHIFEIKWDGTRCLLFKDGKNIRLQNRRLLDITYRFPELVETHREIDAGDAILDGEIVVLSEGKPDFSKLQQREHLLDPLRISIISRKMPATYMAFDILYLNGKSLIEKPLIERKALLGKIIKGEGSIIVSRYVLKEGKRYFDEVISRGFEGVMAKALMSPYLIGKRSRHWLKIKPERVEECYIIGYTAGKGEREKSFGSLVIAGIEEGRLIFRGKVGSGFGEEDLRVIHEMLKEIKVDQPPIPVRINMKVQWVRPVVKCRVSFQELTRDGLFRAPIFRGLTATAEVPHRE